MNKNALFIAAALIATAAASHLITRGMLDDESAPAAGDTNPILYWVAPMDPDYRSDKPGKSPMGMDLVPVYANEQKSNGNAGEVTIAPNVVNNLGVRTAAAHHATLDSEIRTVGYVTYDEDRLIHVHPRVEGWVETLHVKSSGDPVEQGQPLYALYSPELVNAQEEFLLALGRNNARLITAAEDRLASLNIAPSLIDALRRERKVRQVLTFYAPQSGVVDNLNIREGFFVQPGTTLMSVGSLDEVWVEAEIFERQAGMVAVGQPVDMTLDYLPGRHWSGQVDYVYPTLDAATRTIRVRIRVPNPDGQLKPNMFADVSIHAADTSPVLTVPVQSVIRTGRQDRVVLALGEGRFKSVAVTIGRSDGSLVEILDGLAHGDRIVTSAQFLLDSESSRSSDFVRMDHDTMDHSAMDHSAMDHGDDHHD